MTGVICSGRACPRRHPPHLPEPPDLVALDVDEEYRGGAVRQAQLELGGEIALKQGDHGQHGQPGAKRHDDAGGAGARTVKVGERDPRVRAPPSLADQPDPAQHVGRGRRAGRRRRRPPPRRSARAAGAALNTTSVTRAAKSEAEPDQDGGRRQPRRRHDERPEHRRRRHLPRPGQRPDGEDEGGQQPAGRRDQKRYGQTSSAIRIGSTGPKAAASSHGTNCPIASPTRMPIPASARAWSR